MAMKTRSCPVRQNAGNIPGGMFDLRIATFVEMYYNQERTTPCYIGCSSKGGFDMTAADIREKSPVQAIESKRTYTVPEIAAILRISRSNAYDLCKREVFQVIHIGRSVRVSKKSFDEWLDREST
jgi:excisionase family DNA binding protein